MKKAVLWLCCSLCVTCSWAQKSLIESFYDSFQEAEFQVLSVYSILRHPGHFTSTSTYPYKGTKLDTAFYPIIKKLPVNKQYGFAGMEFYATYRFFITDKLEALLLREYEDGGQEHHIHYLVYHNEKKRIIHSEKLSYAYAYEGGMGEMQSWITDLNQDGQKDILSRAWYESMYSGGEQVEYRENTTILIWKDDSLHSLGITDTTLMKGIADDFPFHKAPFLSFSNGKLLDTFLRKNSDLMIGEDQADYYIIAGSDKNLAAAQHEMKRAQKIIGTNYQYHLDFRFFEIHQKGERFYTVITNLSRRNEAAIALKEVRRVFNPTAYIVDRNKWCRRLSWIDRGLYLCE